MNKLNFVTKLLSCIAITTGITNAITAQNTDTFREDIKQVVKPSPEASSLGKYGQIPVSMNTGTPQIELPLYELKGNDLSIPISLSYYGGGFKVAEIASSVGLGWSLCAGGIITRTIKGWPDEATSTGYYNAMAYYNQNIVGTPARYSTNFIQPVAAWKLKADRGEIDLDPDEFAFNFNGYSGRIIFNENKEPICFPFQNLKIEGNINTNWTITTADGTRYLFEKKEYTTFRYGGNYITAWHLTQIQSIRTDEVIYFDYSNNGNSWEEQRSTLPKATLLHFQNTMLDLENTEGNPSQSNYTILTPPVSTLQTDIEATQTCQLQSIRFPKQHIAVNLQYANDRQDVGSESTLQRLTGINVVRSWSSDDAVLSYIFDNNAYFIGTDNQNGDASLRKRLKLLSITEQLTQKRYAFEYNESYCMPSYISPDIDHWGFYNGANNQSFIPALSSCNESVYRKDGLETANREPNAATVGACMLQKITYPTGGSTQFTWEPNIVSYENFPVESNQVITAVCSSGNFIMEPRAIKQANYLQSLVVDDPAMPVNITISSFAKKTGGYILAHVSQWPNSTVNGYCQVYLYKYSDDVNAVIPNRLIGIDIFNNGTLLLNGQNYNLSAGTYLLFAVISKNISAQTISASVTFEEIEYIPYMDKYAGGVRIKEICSKTGANDSIPTTTSYIYRQNYMMPLRQNEPDSYQRSSARLFVDPYYSNYKYENIEPNIQHLRVTSYLSDQWGIPYQQSGSHIGYDEVTEIYNGKQQGFKVTKFMNEDNPAARQFVISESVYNNQGQCLRSVENSYQRIANQPSYYKPVIRLNEYRQLVSTSQGGLQMDKYTISFYQPTASSYTTSWVGLKQTKNKIFMLQTGQCIEDSVQYTYLDNGAHTFITSKKTFGSDGTQNILVYKYPSDFGTSSGILQTLKNMHVISSPIEELNYRNSRLTAARYHEFGTGASSLINITGEYIGNILPGTTLSGLDGYGNLATNSFYEKKNGFTYNTNGNINTIINPNSSTKKAYIWGYNQTLPVVEIQSTDNINIDASIASNIGNHAFCTTDNQNGIQQDIAFMQSQLSGLLTNRNLNITLYTYKPAVGITSETEPNGSVTYYIYDAANRLINTKNDDGSLWNRYLYHFANQ